jgi:type VI protein secretion system component VasF
MNLQQVCRPLFRYVCSIYRDQENGRALSIDKVKSDIHRCFEAMRDSVLGDTILADQLSKMQLPLVFFVDYMIKEGPFEFKNSWTELARDYNELSGDEKFFDILDDTLADPSPSATERISVFYTCIALGFYGCYSSDPIYLERKIKICALRLGIDGGASVRQKFGVQVYETISREKRFKDPRVTARRILVAAFLFLTAVVVLNMTKFNLLVGATRKNFHHVENAVIAKFKAGTPQFMEMEQIVGQEEKQRSTGEAEYEKSPERATSSNRYSEEEIRQALWFPAYKEGMNLNKHYDVTKEYAAKTEKKSRGGAATANMPPASIPDSGGNPQPPFSNPTGKGGGVK